MIRMVKELRHACVMVRNLKRAIRFYRDMLGLDVVKTITIEGRHPEKILGVKGIKLTYVKFRTKNQPKNKPAIFELHYWKRPRPPPQKWLGHISFTVDNIDREYKRLKKVGVRFISKPLRSPVSGHKICFCYDPDRNLIEFAEHHPDGKNKHKNKQAHRVGGYNR